MKKKINNHGFSLVELIVIMIIIVILATAVVVAFVNTADQKVKASSTLISKYLDSTLSTSMTKGSAYMTIGCDSQNNYYVKDSEDHSEKLSSGVNVTYDIENGAEGQLINADNPLMLTYSRINGEGPIRVIEVEKVYTNDKPIEKITVTCNDSSKVIKLYTKTGMYEIE